MDQRMRVGWLFSAVPPLLSVGRERHSQGGMKSLSIGKPAGRAV